MCVSVYSISRTGKMFRDRKTTDMSSAATPNDSGFYETDSKMKEANSFRHSNKKINKNDNHHINLFHFNSTIQMVPKMRK